MQSPSTPWRMRWTITQPGQLEDVLAIVKQAVRKGSLEELGPQGAPPVGPQALSDFEAAGPWPDVIHLHFREPETGACYRLLCETYHGSGGSWGPVENAAQEQQE